MVAIIEGLQTQSLFDSSLDILPPLAKITSLMEGSTPPDPM